MTLRWSLYRYELPLTEPLVLAHGTLAARSGMLVRVEDEAGHEGWGDVAPLPGFSRETLEEAGAATRNVVDGADAVFLGALSSEATYPGLAFDAQTPPSVRFGVDLALADLFAQRRGRSLVRCLAADPADRLSLNALLLGDHPAVMAGAEAARRQGYAAVKLKVGRQAVEDDVALVKGVHDRLGPGVDLRLDANRAWTLEAARAFAEGIADVPLDYLEEPLADPAQLRPFVDMTGLPVALDETVQESRPDDLGRFPYAVAIVLKPTLLGGVAAIRRWAQAARDHGMRPVCSASFESGVGMRHLVALSAAFGPEGTAVGFDTYRWIGEDVLHPRLPLDEPNLDVENVVGRPRRVRMDLLY